MEPEELAFEEETLQSVKLFLVGATGSGKTSILKASADGDRFSTYCEQTSGVDYRIIRSQNSQNKWIKLHVWEAAGNRRFRNIVASYLVTTNHFAFVFDLSNRNSFEELNEWLQITRWAPDSNMFGVLVGNKSDLTREVLEDEALKFVATFGLHGYIEVSAKKGTNLMEMFKFFADSPGEAGTADILPLLNATTQKARRCTCLLL